MKYSNANPYLIGITGGSASGKTSFLLALKEKFRTSQVCVISLDNYYKPLHQQPRDINDQPNFDIPESIDVEAFIHDLDKLKLGEAYERQEYTFNNSNTEPKIIIHQPAPIIIVEGLFIFYIQSVFDKLDLRLFVDAHHDIKWERRLRRDVTERNISEETVKYQWENHVMPSYREYLEPYIQNADVVILNNHNFERSLQMVVNHLKTILNQ